MPNEDERVLNWSVWLCLDTADALLQQLRAVLHLCVPISHGGESGDRLWGVGEGKLTENLLISRRFMTHDPLTLSALNEFAGAERSLKGFGK